ncbi:hypothetical protein A0H81_08842 [Grifola frondosa]|uniref:Glutathione synthase substrate-binding domain-containing protein n=1 Tax=Grifola frondosa TaxID=5627 RepID=A0A1C7M3J4_GRIFR|nr:hypothetical protein A0H81_08842 [Grifola frondosa]
MGELEGVGRVDEFTGRLWNRTDIRSRKFAQVPRNVLDQRWLEYELFEKHSIHVVCQKLSQPGDNVYKDAIPSFLKSLLPQKTWTWIAMELVVPPEGLGNYSVWSTSFEDATEPAVPAADADDPTVPIPAPDAILCARL